MTSILCVNSKPEIHKHTHTRRNNNSLRWSCGKTSGRHRPTPKVSLQKSNNRFIHHTWLSMWSRFVWILVDVVFRFVFIERSMHFPKLENDRLRKGDDRQNVSMLLQWIQCHRRNTLFCLFVCVFRPSSFGWRTTSKCVADKLLCKRITILKDLFSINKLDLARAVAAKTQRPNDSNWMFWQHSEFLRFYVRRRWMGEWRARLAPTQNCIYKRTDSAHDFTTLFRLSFVESFFVSPLCDCVQKKLFARGTHIFDTHFFQRFVCACELLTRTADL